MARLEFGLLSEAWKGEAADFTPLLNEQLDQVGSEIGVDLTSVGKTEVVTTGGRRIDIVAEDAEGSEFVIENQYGRADHGHLTRGLAYAVARRARGLIVVAEEHRDEFRAVAEYLNDLAEQATDGAIYVWLIEAKAVRIGDSEWAPLFSTVVAPNSFTASVEQSKAAQPRLGSDEELWEQFTSLEARAATSTVLAYWGRAGHRHRLGPDHVVLEARGPSQRGVRAVIRIYTDGRVVVPLSSYAGMNTGIPIGPLTDADFRAEVESLFGLSATGQRVATPAEWLTPERADGLLAFCMKVADAYAAATSDPDADRPTALHCRRTGPRLSPGWSRPGPQMSMPDTTRLCWPGGGTTSGTSTASPVTSTGTKAHRRDLS